MSNKKMHVIADSNSSANPFEELSKKFVPFPDLVKFPENETDPKKLEAVAAQVREKAEELKNWVLKTLLFLDAMKRLSREAREMVAGKIAQGEEKIDYLLRKETTPAYRRASWLAYLTHYLTKHYVSFEEAEGKLKNLVKDGLLEQKDDGPLSFRNIHYTVPAEAAFDEQEITEIDETLKKLAEEISEKEREIRRVKTDELMKMAETSLSLQDLLDGKEGKMLILVPPEKVFVHGEETVKRNGGILLVESDGEKIRPLDCVSEEKGGENFEKGIQEAMTLRVYLLVKSLFNSAAPEVKSLSEDSFRKVQLLYYLLRRAFITQREDEKVHTDLERLKTKATVQPSEFFLEKKEGVCLVDHRGWKSTNGVHDVFFLIKRRIVGEESFIAIEEAPEHLKVFLRSCQGKEFPEDKTPYPLGVILRTMQSHQKTAEESEKK